MFRRLNVSDAAANTATSVTPASTARSSPFRFGTSAEYRVPGRRAMPRKTSLGVGHLRHPLRAHERGDLDGREAGRGQPIDERNLLDRRDGRGFVLESVAWTDFV